MIHEATCQYGACGNYLIPISLLRPPEVIVCGLCRHPISDISPPLPEEPYEQTPPLT